MNRKLWIGFAVAGVVYGASTSNTVKQFLAFVSLGVVAFCGGALLARINGN